VQRKKLYLEVKEHKRSENMKKKAKVQRKRSAKKQKREEKRVQKVIT
jgi:hypothetical protein